MAMSPSCSPLLVVGGTNCNQPAVLAREYAEALRAPNLRARLSVSGSSAATAACLCLVRHPCRPVCAAAEVQPARCALSAEARSL
jgi:hypothetical protein